MAIITNGSAVKHFIDLATRLDLDVRLSLVTCSWCCWSWKSCTEGLGLLSPL
jgi:hypothetical protein